MLDTNETIFFFFFWLGTNWKRIKIPNSWLQWGRQRQLQWGNTASVIISAACSLWSCSLTLPSYQCKITGYSMDNTRPNTELTIRAPSKVIYVCSLDSSQIEREFAFNKKLHWLSWVKLNSFFKSLLILYVICHKREKYCILIINTSQLSDYTCTWGVKGLVRQLF